MSRLTHFRRCSVTIALAVAAALSVRAYAGPEDDDPGAASMLIATADFNGDGIADVAEIPLPENGQKAPSSLTVLLGQKNRSYRTLSRRPLSGDDPRAMVAGDFNGDGKADLLIGYGDGAIVELLGDGKGGLTPAGEIAHEGSVVSIAVGDFNHDHIPDIAVSDFNSNAVTILLGSGKGAFHFGWSFALPMRGNAYYLAAADFNADGIPDLAITSDEEGTFIVMLANGNGTFTYAPALSRMKDPNSYCPT